MSMRPEQLGGIAMCAEACRTAALSSREVMKWIPVGRRLLSITGEDQQPIGREHQLGGRGQAVERRAVGPHPVKSPQTKASFARGAHTRTVHPPSTMFAPIGVAGLMCSWLVAMAVLRCRGSKCLPQAAVTSGLARGTRIVAGEDWHRKASGGK